MTVLRRMCYDRRGGDTAADRAPWANIEDAPDNIKRAIRQFGEDAMVEATLRLEDDEILAARGRYVNVDDWLRNVRISITGEED